MGHSRKTRHGQLRPLHERRTPEQMQQRAAKTEVRRLLSVEHAKTRGLALGAQMVLARGIVGRFKWLLVGR